MNEVVINCGRLEIHAVFISMNFQTKHNSVFRRFKLFSPGERTKKNLLMERLFFFGKRLNYSERIKDWRLSK